MAISIAKSAKTPPRGLIQFIEQAETAFMIAREEQQAFSHDMSDESLLAAAAAQLEQDKTGRWP